MSTPPSQPPHPASPKAEPRDLVTARQNREQLRATADWNWKRPANPSGDAVSPEVEERLLADLATLTRHYNIPGWGEAGGILNVVETVGWEQIAVADWEIRETWRAADPVLAASMQAVGIVEPMLCTTILPGDPLHARGKSRLLFAGRRRYRQLAEMCHDRIPVRVYACLGGQPIPRYRQVELYLSRHVRQPLTREQITRGIVMYERFLEEWCADNHQPYQRASQRDAARNLNIGKTTAQRAYQFLDLGDEVADALIEGMLPATIAEVLVARIPNRDELADALLHIADQNRDRAGLQVARLTLDESVELVTGSPSHAPATAVTARVGESIPPVLRLDDLRVVALLDERPDADAAQILGALMLDLKRALGLTGMLRPDAHEVSDLAQLYPVPLLAQAAADDAYDQVARELRDSF